MVCLPESIHASSFPQRSPDLSPLSVDADRLRVIAPVSDGLGNTGTRTREIEVIDPLALEAFDARFSLPGGLLP